MPQSRTADTAANLTTDGALAVEAAGVTKSFGSVDALRGVDLGVPAGSITALLGPNGAGKTTLVRIIATLSQPDRGRVTVFGLDVVSAAAQVRGRIGLTGQYVGLEEALSGLDNLVLIGRLAGLSRRRARERAAELAESLGIAFALGRTVRTYSGGMRRRLDLAASLMARPPLIVLDEPTTGLDPASRQQLWESLAGLRASGTTMLLTTQYLEEADRFADIVHVMNEGQIIASGTSAELKDHVADRVIDLTLDRAADCAAAVATLVSELSLEESQVQAEPGTGRLSVAAEGGTDALLRAAAALRDRGIPLADISLRQPTLDEAFLALTAGDKR
jgi:ABC-2 type transport system ATP-binding protein